MKVQETKLKDCFIIHDTVFEDPRGYFFESFNQQRFASLIGLNVSFVQDNQSKSTKGVLRGLHFQQGDSAQAKLVRVLKGTVLDVAVDLRRSSATFGKHISVELSAENKRMLWIPEGFAHGFVVLSEVAEFLYKTTDFWVPEHERSLAWNDPTIGIDWGLQEVPKLSAKDQQAKNLNEAAHFA